MKKNRLLLRYSYNLGVTKMMLSCILTALLMAISSTLWAQTAPFTVKGKVSDAKGEALIGVTVKASDGVTTSTDVNGAYSIRTGANASLTFTYLGYDAVVIQVANQTTVNATLTTNNKQLSDVVVVGYGTQKRKDVTGAIATVKFEGGPKETIPFVNPLEALQGTPGINVGPSTSAGATPNIVVRGQNSVTAATSPLIVLDGVIFNGNLNEINMNDVATFDILKDASSAAIYGSRSQNGVILITTKRGKTDKPTINFNTYYGIQNWTRVPKMRTGEDFLQWRKDNLSIRGTDVTDPTKVFLAPLEQQAYNEGHQIDWLDDITQYAPIKNYEVSISGRTAKTNYYFSAGFLDQKGVLNNDNFKKPNFTLKLENNITDWLSYGANAYYSSRDYSGISPDVYIATYMSPYSYKYVAGTNDQLLQRYPTGSTSFYNPYWGNVNQNVPAYIDDNRELYTSIRGTGFINIKFPFIRGLNYRFDVTGTRGTTDYGYFHHESGNINTLIPGDIANPSQFLSTTRGTKTNTLTDSWLFNNLLTYTRSFGNHNIDALIGYTRDNFHSNAISLTGSNFATNGTTVLGFYGLNAATTITGVTNDSKFSNVGYIGRLNYNYKNKYYATVNFRRDGFTAFAEGQKFGFFPGASVAWALSEESFMKNVSFVNYLKLRASYGRTGNQGISPYQTQSLTSTGYTIFGSNSTFFTTPSTLGNQELTWEKTDALNFGVDFTLFNNRVYGNIDAYKSKTTDQLITRFIPIFTGYNTVQSNRGEVANKGLEVTINTVNIKAYSGFRWETGFNFWINRNKLVHLNGADANGDGKEDDDIGNSFFIGKSLGAIYDLTFDGIVQTTDVDYIKTYGAVAGDVKFKDLNNDGKLNDLDRSVIGYAKENYNFNISNTFSYKNFQLYFTINAIIGGGKDNFFMSTNLRGLNPGAVLSASGNWLNQPYWMPNNPSNEYPRPNYANPYGYGFYQSRTFARLQQASLSYTFTQAVLKKIKVSNLKVYVSGTNLFTATGWTGLDPANGAQIGGNGGSTNSSVNQSNPIMRSVTFGLNLGF
jgi:TonB-linked SusC/RagA family outer membrane protein